MNRNRSLEEIQEDIRTLTRVPSEFIHAKLNELAEEVGELTKSKWIPCSERLPKDRQIVVADIECSIEDRMCIFAYFKIVDHMEHWINANTGFPVLANVVQWTPLPEPYREERHE